MRIVVWGINYAPERLGIGPCNVALCEYLASHGCDTTMLTSFPYYPAWKKHREDRMRIFESEELNGVRVLRCWHYVPNRVNTPKRMLHELSFVALSFPRLIFLAKPDLLIVISPPLLAGVLAHFFCRLRGGKYLLHLQDLQPDAAVSLSMVKSSYLIRVLKNLESIAYQGAWRISAISGGMLDILRKRGVPEAKLRYFPNGTDPAIRAPKGRFRAVNRFDPEHFLVVYAGNLGVKQGLQHLIVTMRFIRNPSVQLVICGEGAEKERLLAMVTASVRNVWFKGVLEPNDYREMLADADLMVVSLVSGSGTSFFPSKLLSACSAGKPVLAICDIDSELAAIVETNRCGVVVRAGDVEGLAQKLEELSRSPQQLESMGRAAKRLSDQFLWSEVLRRFAQEAEILAG
jgi:colanic acid biosynthesis glycosyl transferase WcaI